MEEAKAKANKFTVRSEERFTDDGGVGDQRVGLNNTEKKTNSQEMEPRTF